MPLDCRVWLMLHAAPTTTRGSLAVSAGVLEVTVSFKALPLEMFVFNINFFRSCITEILVVEVVKQIQLGSC